MDKIKLAISPCPNDTFIFGALIRRDIEVPFDFEVVMEDIQLCNNMALSEEKDIVKVSFGVFPLIKESYKILKCGGALGFGCGPLLLSKKYNKVEELKGKKVAIPGENTTAFAVFKKFYQECATNIEIMRFDKIMPAIRDGKVDAGLVIHEGRFTYENYGLTKLTDIGVEWESKYNLPIPLGFIAIHKKYLHMADDVNNAIRKSIEYAYNNREKALLYCKNYAQDMDNNVMNSHINLYVNKYSKDLTPAISAISALLNVGDDVFA